ncbi:hypothetical protein ACQ4PT_067290 [Festuca glaucescens]
MASSVLETARAAHEELELLERLAVRELQRQPANACDCLRQSHRISNIVDCLVTASQKLVETYEDKDGARKEEMSTLITAVNQDDIFHRFEDKLREIHASHTKYHSSFVSETDNHDVLLKDDIKFSDELESEFEVQWANGEASVLQESGIDLNQYNTAEELVELGMEKLKEALAAVGLKCGGTVQQRADRFFLLKHKQLQQLDSKHFAKVSRGSVSNVPSNGNTVKDGLKKQNALLEAKMSHLCEILDEVITRTKEKAEKTLPLNSEEMEVEREEAYWDWSWDEIAAYDLPVVLQFVYDHIGGQNVHYISHSLGTLIILAAFSECKLLHLSCNIHDHSNTSHHRRPDELISLSPCTNSWKHGHACYRGGIVGGLLRVDDHDDNEGKEDDGGERLEEGHG